MARPMTVPVHRRGCPFSVFVWIWRAQLEMSGQDFLMKRRNELISSSMRTSGSRKREGKTSRQEETEAEIDRYRKVDRDKQPNTATNSVRGKHTGMHSQTERPRERERGRQTAAARQR